MDSADSSPKLGKRMTELLAQKDRLLAEQEVYFNTKLAEKDRLLAEQQARFDALTLQPGYLALQQARRLADRLAPAGSRRGQLSSTLRRGILLFLNLGPRAFFARVLQPWKWLPRAIGRRDPSPTADRLSLDEQYQVWLQLHAHTTEDIIRMRQEAAELRYRPKISIIVPTYNTDPKLLAVTIASVRGQYYDNWELCIADDYSANQDLRRQLEHYASENDRIKLTLLNENHGISGASNAALALASGDYITFLDHDDELKPNALFEVAKLLNRQPDLDLIYSDEDKRNVNGQLVQPFFKPDWSPDLLLSINYICHLAVYRRSLVEEVGGLRSQCDFSQDFDLLLRFTERTKRIAHIPLPLYTWRMTPGSAAASPDAKPASQSASAIALTDALKRRSIKGSVEPGFWQGTHRVRYTIRNEPLVSIIIPTKDRLHLLRTCLDSLRARTVYGNYEILVVDNESQEDATLEYFERLGKDPRISVIRQSGAFNFAVLNNVAAQRAHGQHLVLLNNDTEVIRGEWLGAMLEHSQRPEVGAVGARLLYTDGRLQHAGVVLGIGGVAGHSHKYMPRDDHGYFSRAVVIQNYSAVTAACLMMRKQVYEELGGLDEENLAVAFGDVDLCLRAREKGYLVVWTPFAELYHHESASRGPEETPEKQARFSREVQYMLSRWGDSLLLDPYYNSNLSLIHEDFSLRV